MAVPNLIALIGLSAGWRWRRRGAYLWEGDLDRAAPPAPDCASLEPHPGGEHEQLAAAASCLAST